MSISYCGHRWPLPMGKQMKRLRNSIHQNSNIKYEQNPEAKVSWSQRLQTNHLALWSHESLAAICSPQTIEVGRDKCFQRVSSSKELLRCEERALKAISETHLIINGLYFKKIVDLCALPVFNWWLFQTFPDNRQLRTWFTTRQGTNMTHP